MVKFLFFFSNLKCAVPRGKILSEDQRICLVLGYPSSKEGTSQSFSSFHPEIAMEYHIGMNPYPYGTAYFNLTSEDAPVCGH